MCAGVGKLEPGLHGTAGGKACYPWGPFHIRNLFRNSIYKFRNFSFESISTFTFEINCRKPTSSTLHSMFVNTGRLTNHSARTSEISSAKFRKIEHVLIAKYNFQIYFFRKLTVHTRNFLVKLISNVKGAWLLWLRSVRHRPTRDLLQRLIPEGKNEKTAAQWLVQIQQLRPRPIAKQP